MKMRVYLMLFVLTISFFAAACEKVTIAKLIDNPTKYADKEVGVIGTVSNSYGVSILGQGGGAYEISDGTGKIWVLTQRGVPIKGARIGVKGQLQNGAVINGKNYLLAIIEDDRRVK